MVIFNFKTYLESTGSNASNLLSQLVDLTEEDSSVAKKFACALSIVDLVTLKSEFPDFTFMSQHVDNVNPGSTTGHVTPENLIDYGIEFSIYNHSEKRIPTEEIIENIQAIQAKGIKLIVCCENVAEAEKLLEAKPYALAYEPKDLIGSGVSVTTRPEVVSDFVNATKGKTMVFIGAGVTNGEDVTKAIELGAEGVLLASAFVKAEDPKSKAKELIEPFL